MMAREFAREGARLAICARDEEELEQARIDLENFGAEVMTVQCDVRDRQEVKTWLPRSSSRFGHIDVLVNNAGVIQVGPIEVMTHEDFELAMKAHFWGPLNTIMAVLPSMRQRKAGTHRQHQFDRRKSQCSASCSLQCEQVCSRWTLERFAR